MLLNIQKEGTVYRYAQACEATWSVYTSDSQSVGHKGTTGACSNNRNYAQVSTSMYIFKCIYLYKSELTQVIGGGEFVKFFITLI